MGSFFKPGHNQSGGIGLNLFTDQERDIIHAATMDVMYSEGIKVISKKAQEIYADGGCIVDSKLNRVRFPAHVVEDAIKSAPAVFLQAGRNAKNDFMCGSGVSFTNFGEGIEIIDLFTGERRGTTKEDVADTARMCDAMDQINIHVKAVGANEAPVEVRTLYMYEAVFTSTSKHCLIGGGDVYNIRKGMEIAAACVGGMDNLRQRPIYTASFCTNSPLTLNPDLTDPVIELAREGIPIMINSMPMTGATSPITSAGTLVIHGAEVLAGITLAQLVRKEHTVIYGSSILNYDFMYNCSPVGTPEAALLNAGVARMANYYSVPSFVGGG